MRISDWSSDLCSSDLGRIIVNAELCRRIVVARHDVRFLDARAALQFNCQPAYAAVSLIFDFRQQKRNIEAHLVFHCCCPLPINPRMSERAATEARSEEHTSELLSLMRISYAVFCLKKHTHTTLLPTK